MQSYLDACPPERGAPVSPSPILYAEMVKDRFRVTVEVRRAGDAYLVIVWRIILEVNAVVVLKREIDSK